MIGNNPEIADPLGTFKSADVQEKPHQKKLPQGLNWSMHLESRHTPPVHSAHFRVKMLLLVVGMTGE